MTRSHFDEEEYQGKGEDSVNILEEERLDCEVEIMDDQVEAVQGGAIASKVEKVNWASSQARMVQQEGKHGRKRKVCKKRKIRKGRGKGRGEGGGCMLV